MFIATSAIGLNAFSGDVPAEDPHNSSLLGLVARETAESRAVDSASSLVCWSVHYSGQFAQYEEHLYNEMMLLILSTAKQAMVVVVVE